MTNALTNPLWELIWSNFFSILKLDQTPATGFMEVWKQTTRFPPFVPAFFFFAEQVVMEERCSP